MPLILAPAVGVRLALPVTAVVLASRPLSLLFPHLGSAVTEPRLTLTRPRATIIALMLTGALVASEDFSELRELTLTAGAAHEFTM